MKRLLSITICTIILLSGLGIPASASETFQEGPYKYTVTDGNATIVYFDRKFEGALEIPDTLGGYPVTEIGTSAFENCKGITEISIPGSVHTIGYKAFYFCEFKSVRLNEGLNLIGGNAFQYATELESINLPESLTMIGGDAFRSAVKLKNIKIPDSVCVLGAGAFHGCVSLEEVNIPKSLTSIADRTFFECKKLAKIYIHSGITEIGNTAFSGCASLKNVESEVERYAVSNNALIDKSTKTLLVYIGEETEYSIEDGIETIEAFAFYPNSKLEKVTIPGSVKTIGDGAFENCINLKEINFQYGVRELGDACFNNCKSLENVVLPDSIEIIGKYAFKYCKGLKSITLPFVGRSRNEPDGVTTWMAYLYSSSIPPQEVPPLLEKIVVTDTEYIAKNAFNYCYNVKEIHLSDKVKNMGEGVFLRCKSLEKVTLPSELTEIPESAFSECTALEKIDIPAGVTVIGNYAFNDCKSLKSIELPDLLETIGTGAFSNCAKLENITIPETVKHIGGKAFLNTLYFEKASEVYCGDTLVGVRPNIQEYTVKEGTVHIGEYAFYDSKVKSVKIPDSVRTIGDSAFCYCDSIVSIVIPDGVTEIGKQTFSYCRSLKSISLPGTVKKIGKAAFGGCKSLENVFIPRGIEYMGDNLFIFAGENTESIGIYYGGTKEEWETVSEHLTFSVEKIYFNVADFNIPMSFPRNKEQASEYVNQRLTKEKFKIS